MTRRAVVRAGASLLLGVGVVTLVWAGPAAPARATIGVFQFQPARLDVLSGGRVTWTNQDDIGHTVTSGLPGSPDGRFDVPLAGKGTSGGVVFPDPGVYPYFCARHPSMRGEVVVR
jgi:plastocyanin